ncbi:hypothetical protein R6Z07F_003033 [Ovis aries]
MLSLESLSKMVGRQVDVMAPGDPAEAPQGPVPILQAADTMTGLEVGQLYGEAFKKGLRGLGPCVDPSNLTSTPALISGHRLLQAVSSRGDKDLVGMAGPRRCGQRRTRWSPAGALARLALVSSGWSWVLTAPIVASSWLLLSFPLPKLNGIPAKSLPLQVSPQVPAMCRLLMYTDEKKADALSGERLGAITIPSNQLFRSMDSWKIYTAEQTALVMAAPGPSHVYVTRHHSWKTQYGGLTHKQVWESAALPRPQFSCPSKKIY